MQKYAAAEGNVGEQQRWANEFWWELARHSAGEKLVVYPAFEKKKVLKENAWLVKIEHNIKKQNNHTSSN